MTLIAHPPPARGGWPLGSGAVSGGPPGGGGSERRRSSLPARRLGGFAIGARIRFGVLLGQGERHRLDLDDPLGFPDVHAGTPRARRLQATPGWPPTGRLPTDQ